MQLIRRLLLCGGGTLLALVLLAGCGTNTSGGTNHPPDLTSPGATSPVSSSPPTPAKPTSTARTGAVTIQVGKGFYHASETIMVTVRNHRSQTIWFPDHQTNCTVILLQRSKAQPQAPDQGQTGINACKLMIATRMHSLAAGQQLVVQLVAPREGWPTGITIATLNYRDAPTANSATTASSSAFTIGPLGL